MQTARAGFGPSDRTLSRLIRILFLVLILGVPLFVGFYWLDRHVDPAPAQADRAIAAAEENVRQAPQDLGARNTLGAAYVSAGRYQEGVDQFGQVLQTDPANRPALLGRALAYFHANQLDQARSDFQAFVDKNSAGEFAKTDPQLEQAYYELGVIAITQGRPADAVTVLGKALAIDSGDADALYSFGVALVKTGDATKGVAALRTAVAFVPSGWCDPYASLVDGYTALGTGAGVTWATAMVDFCHDRLDTAETSLKTLVSGDMKTDALLGLALVAARRGDTAAAAGYYRQVLAIDPKNASASIGLGQLGQTVGPSAAPSSSPAGGS